MCVRALSGLGASAHRKDEERDRIHLVVRLESTQPSAIRFVNNAFVSPKSLYHFSTMKIMLKKGLGLYLPIRILIQHKKLNLANYKKHSH